MTRRALNEACPWSGDPVSADSLTTYRGRTVGFCKPGCRDKFVAAVAHFDQALATAESSQLAGMNSVEVAAYKPRYFEFDGIWYVDDVQFKTYLISGAADDPVSQPLVDNARRYVERRFPAIRRQEGNDHGFGYIILHQGEMSNWLLIHWWAFQDIALRMLASADNDASAFKSKDHRHFHACVWEHVVIDHERDAWVRSMMTENSGAPAYVADKLCDGAY